MREKIIRVPIFLKIMLFFVFILIWMIIYSLSIGVGKVEAAPIIKTATFDVEGNAALQIHDIIMPSDFSNLISVTVDSGSVMNSIVGSGSINLILNNGTKKTTTYEYSGYVEGTLGAPARSSGFYSMGLKLTTTIYQTNLGRCPWDCSDEYGMEINNIDGSSTKVRNYHYYKYRTAIDTYTYKVTIQYTDNIEPNHTLNMVNGQMLGPNNHIVLNGSVLDTDVGDILTVKYTIDGTVYVAKTIPSFTANGTNQNYSNDIVIDNGIPEGTHAIRVWVEDNKGGKSQKKYELLP